MNTSEHTPPRAGRSAGSARIRSEPADFVVEEIIEMQPEAPGEHLWLQVRKRGENTDHVARLLARAAGVAPAAVGYAGRKDRHALTTQWFSVQLPGRPAPDDWQLPDSVEILHAERRLRKLQTGGLRGNRFVIRLRDVRGDRALLDARLQALRERGAPNYFGVQRFGREASNLERARALFRDEIRVRDHKQRGMLLSAARSCLFNTILSRRVQDGSWCEAQPGDLLILDGRGSFFAADSIDETLRARVAAGELHPSGALWGRGATPAGGAVALLEQAVAAEHAVLADGLERAGLRQERRALRLLPREFEWTWEDAATLQLRFVLPPGCYATTLLDEVLDLHDAHADAGVGPGAD